MIRADRWPAYLARFHAERPGITEAALTHARAVDGDAYDWLVRALPADSGTVLDVACGDAPVRARLSVARRYVGMDLSEAELRLGLRLRWALPRAGLRPVSLERRRYAFPLRDREDAHLAVRSLYTPGRSPERLAAAENALARRAGPGQELGVPLLRAVALRV